jgi:hypothetical protein
VANVVPPSDRRLSDGIDWPSGQRSGLRPALIRGAFDALARVGARGGRTVLALEYPPSAAPGPRHGHGRPVHRRIEGLLEAGRERYARHLEAMRPLLAQLGTARGPEEAGPQEPYWNNVWLSGLDAASLHYFLVSRRPRRYVEIGSGMSTRWARRAIRQGTASTTITSIDPHPRREIDALCDHPGRQPLETVDLAVFDGLVAGDVVFMDGSHRAFTNSDATVFMLDVLPDLPSGVLVGIHDILLPADYPPEWTRRYYSEQYLLAAYLLGAGERAQIELPCYFVVTDPSLGSGWRAGWRAAGLDGAPLQGQTFWLTVP